jgi:glycosyltransferase involved in cell wall biosynthesis
MVDLIVHEADIVFTVSSYARQFLKNEYGINEEKIVEIPRGARFLKANIDYAQKEPSAVYSGSISPHENLLLFIRSIPLVQRKLKKCSFYITGKGEYKSKLEKAAKQCSANIRFLWFPDRVEYQSFISQCSVGVIPWANTVSRRFGFPIKLLNYLSVGLPVVITNIGEWSELVGREKLGIVVESTPESFAEGILELLSDPNMAKECGRRGIRLIEERYNWENSAKIIYNEYFKMLL